MPSVSVRSCICRRVPCVLKVIVIYCDCVPGTEEYLTVYFDLTVAFMIAYYMKTTESKCYFVMYCLKVVGLAFEMECDSVNTFDAYLTAVHS